MPNSLLITELSRSEQASIVGGTNPTFAQIQSMFKFDSTAQPGSNAYSIFVAALSDLYVTTFGQELLYNLYDMGGFFNAGAKQFTVHDMSQDKGYSASVFNFDFYDASKQQIDIGVTGTSVTPAAQLYYVAQALWHAHQHTSETETTNYYGGASSSIYLPGTTTLDPTLANLHTSPFYELDADLFAAAAVLQEGVLTGSNWYATITNLLPTASQSWQTTAAEKAAHTAFVNAWNTAFTYNPNAAQYEDGPLVGNVYNTMLSNFALGSSYFSSDPTAANASAHNKSLYQSFNQSVANLPSDWDAEGVVTFRLNTNLVPQTSPYAACVGPILNDPWNLLFVNPNAGAPSASTSAFVLNGGGATVGYQLAQQLAQIATLTGEPLSYTPPSGNVATGPDGILVVIPPDVEAEFTALFAQMDKLAAANAASDQIFEIIDPYTGQVDYLADADTGDDGDDGDGGDNGGNAYS